MPRTASILALLLSAACGTDAPIDASQQSGASIKGVPETSAEACVDADGDGFGPHCEDGPDCDDADDTIFEGCDTCAEPEEGCGCAPDTLPVECTLSSMQVGDDNMLCKTGKRYCRDRHWTECVGVGTFTQ